MGRPVNETDELVQGPAMARNFTLSPLVRVLDLVDGEYLLSFGHADGKVWPLLTVSSVSSGNGRDPSWSVCRALACAWTLRMKTWRKTSS